jgi:hypothetical protein
MSEQTVDRGEIAADLEGARNDFLRLLSLVCDDEWNKPTSGTRWSNEELLFHVVFGYMVVKRLLILSGSLDAYPTASVADSLGFSTQPHRS